MSIQEDLKNGYLLIDGAFGTMIQARGLKLGEHPEKLNLSDPKTIIEIHEEYVAAGADVITANTFQANSYKITEQLEEIIHAGVKLAKASGARYVAYDMGPVGKLMEPMGEMTFDEAYEIFKEQAVFAEAAGADLVIVETFSDLLEIKAAILAIKENTDLAIFATLTYQEDGRTFVGVDPVAATLTIQSLGADAVGVNCSLGPDCLHPVVRKITSVAKIPVVVQANAGLPKMKDGETFYDYDAKKYAVEAGKLLDEGVQILGGCCGTTPKFISAMRELIDSREFAERHLPTHTTLTSSTKTYTLDGKLSIIGERINPTGKKLLKEAIKNQDLNYILKLANEQVEVGADILDVNVGLPEIDEAAFLTSAIKEIQTITDLPLQIDSVNIKALEAGARAYNGRPLINSVNGEEKSMTAILPIVKKYGALVLGLCLDETGIPETAEKRFAIAQKIIDRAGQIGIAKEDILIDPLVLTASAQQSQVQVTLDTLKLLKEAGIQTVVGLSNVSFGLPNREIINSSFLASAVACGLSAPIMNPNSAAMMNTVRALRIFNNQDQNSVDYIENVVTTEVVAVEKAGKSDQPTEKNLSTFILKGEKEAAKTATQELLKDGKSPLEIVNDYFMPALNEVGEKFESGKMFLPQLMMSAEAVTLAQDELKKALLDSGQEVARGEKIVMATVEGDIHDIGKNIVKMILENYGYDVIDLGKDVKIQAVVDAVVDGNIKLVGLSALMTTTVESMKQTIAAVKAQAPETKFMVGGAVLSEEYKEYVGADFYAKDALDAVRMAKEIF
ncbi:MAG: homocysteine S-methyltransferase family protein [Lactobacillales bacterium]|jgi:5-methyltetrahydrofolate--homocysteine methyltransferase|nr:homocysteine S-methyltransferase family protein [Lactobacillales bacterium]